MSSGSLRLGAAAWLALRGGRTERLRLVVTALASAVATTLLLLAGAVISMPAGDLATWRGYSLRVFEDPGLRPGIVLALLLLAAPVVAVSANAARLGSPERERRLTALRLAGATTGAVRGIVALEGVIGAAIGAVVGGIAYALGCAVLVARRGHETVRIERDVIGPDGRLVPQGPLDVPNALPGPIDVVPHPLLVVAALLLPLIGAAALGWWVARRVVRAPLRGASAEPVRPSAVAAVAALAGAAVAGALPFVGGSWFPRALGLPLAVLAVGLAVGTLMSTTALVGSAVGRWAAPRTSRPDVLLAARRLVAAPRAATRPATAVVLAVLVGGLAVGARASTLATENVDREFFGQTYDLVLALAWLGLAVAAVALLIGVVEGLVSRRRVLARLVAAGAARAVVGRAVVLAAVAPLVPSVLLAAVLGTTAGWLVTAPGVPTAYPWAGLGLLVVGAWAAVVLAATTALTLLRSSTDTALVRVPA